MPRGPKKKITTKSPAYIALLLVKIFLIKIGDLPFWFAKIAWGPVSSISRRASSISGFAGSLRLRAGTTRFCLPPLRLSSILHTTNYKPRHRGRPKKFRLPGKYKIALGIGIFLIFVFSYTIFLLTAAYQLPSPTRLISPNQPVTTEFYDRNNTLLYRLYEGKNRTLVNLTDIPKTLIQATIATEDRNFYHHIGIDPTAIVRALYHNFKTGGQEGASTITQQLIKNSLLNPEKTYGRKFREIILALWVERVYPKDQILQMYFNEAPYGGSLVGIAAASQTYFGKPPPELNLAESAFLSGLPVSPTQFSPYGNRPDLAKLRQKQVLEGMVQERYISQAEADKAFAEDLNIKPPVNDILAPHFVMFVRDFLSEKYGPRVVSQGGLKIYTTLDLNLQEKVEKIVKEEVDALQPLNVQNGAVLVTATNGQILAMVGSKDYHEPGFGNFNVTTALRQPGSSIKVITYATAFKKGFSPGNTILDTPVSFKDGAGSYSPVNYDGKFHGPVSIRTALGSSYNIPAVRAAAIVGINEVIKTAKDLGISTFDEPNRFGLSLTLGGGEVKMIDMMSVYGTLANLGVKKYPTPFLKVTDSSGNILEEYKEGGKQVLEPGIAYLITDILKDNKARTPAFGPISLLHIPGYEVSVKTGTSDKIKDNWTFGYTPKYVVGVWVGNPDSSPLNPRLTSGVTGAAPIWNKIIHMLLDGTKPLSFNRPSSVTESLVDGRKDLSLTGALPKSLVRTSFSSSSHATPSAIPDQQANQATPTLPNL